MKVIVTRYLSPSNVRGARIVATAEGGHRIVIGYDHSLDSEGCHGKAARALADKLDWRGQLIGGHLPKGMAWVFDDPFSPRVILKAPARKHATGCLERGPAEACDYCGNGAADRT